MLPSFGHQFSPGDLLTAKNFERVGSLDIETVSDESLRTDVCYRNVDSSKLLVDLCAMLDCSNGQQMVKAVMNAKEQLEPLLNFLYSQPNHFPCFGFSVVRKENESCFEISHFENSPADLMVSKTVIGTFYLCVLTSKLAVNNSVIQKFAAVLKQLPDIKKEQCEYFDGQSINITVFANWNDIICNQMTAYDTFKKMALYSKEKINQQVISFEVDDFTKCLPVHPIPLDPNFDECYRLMRSIKNKGAELREIYDSKKKKNDKSTSKHFKYLLTNLEKELKETYFLKYEHIEELNGIFIDVTDLLESFLNRWQLNGTALDVSFFQMIENCLTMFLAKYKSGNCSIKNNTIFYNADEPDDLMKLFESKAFIALKCHTNNFKEWIIPKFLHLYPLCYIKNYPSLPDSFFLCQDGAINGFGTVTVKKSSRKQKSDFDYEAFCCVNAEHKSDRYWKCTTCKEYVTSNDRKEISCKCGINSYNNVEFRCSFSGGQICTKNSVAESRQKSNDSKDLVESEGGKAYNILLFGPVGSGKSTLINAAMNYLEYPTYTEATSHPLIAKIPYNFSFIDDNFQQKLVKSQEIPDDCPENFSSSSYTTQRPKIYEFYSGGKSYRFIDTVGFSVKEFPGVTLNFWRKLKRIDAIWITISATQNLGDDDSWIRRIVKCVPKKMFSRVYFVFTNIDGKHALRSNSNLAALANFFSKNKEFPFEENRIFAIENNCLKSLYAQRSGCTLSEFQASLNQKWIESRLVILHLIGNASASKSDDDNDVFFLKNLFYLYFRLKKDCSEKQLAECSDLLGHNFMTLSRVKDTPPSYGDVMKSLQNIRRELSNSSNNYRFLVEFIEMFGVYTKDQNPGVIDCVKSFVTSVSSFFRL